MDSESIIILSISFLIVLYFLFWYWQNFIAIYSQFPTYRIYLDIFYWHFTRKRMTVTSIVLQKCLSLSKQYQSEGLCLVWLFHPFLLVFGEESVKAFIKEPEAIDKSFIYRFMEEMMGQGLITSNGNKWKCDRKLCNPLFYPRMLKNNFGVFNKHAAILVERLTEVAEKPSVELEDYIFSAAIAIICEAVIEQGEQNSARVRRIHYLIDRGTKFISYRIIHPYLYWKFSLPLFPAGRNFLKHMEEWNTLIKEILTQMKNAMTPQDINIKKDFGPSEHSSGDFKSPARMLLETHIKDPSFTMQDVVDHIKTLISAGFDTTAYTLIWCTFMLGLHQDVQEQVYNEIRKLGEGDVTYDDLSELTYLDCVIKETMRLCTPVPIYARNLRNTVMFGKYIVPKGTNILFSPYSYHRNTQLYPDPETFDPGRFMDGSLNKHPWTHIAFSEGRRNCIGKKFALLEIKVILVYILRKFKVIALDRKEDVEHDWTITLRSVKPLRTKLCLRH